jgi:hypothetical protein
MSEEENIKQFDSEQLEIVLNDLQDIDKFTGFKDGAFKYELGRYQANLLINQIKKCKEVIDTLEFIKARAKEGATQETINKLAINFVNSYIK